MPGVADTESSINNQSTTTSPSEQITTPISHSPTSNQQNVQSNSSSTSNRSSTPIPTYAVHTMIGGSHEENHIPNQDTQAINSSSRFHIFAVLDGHGPQGDTIAKNTANALVQSLTEKITKLTSGSSSERRRNAVYAAFAATAELIDSQPASSESGTTASVIVVEGLNVIIANVGDSDVVWARDGRNAQIVSFAHRPSNLDEEKRVSKAGGIIQNGYISSGDPFGKIISVTRAFGDLDVRSLGVISQPQIREIKLGENDFLILASDGLWDAHGGFTSQRAVDIARKCMEFERRRGTRPVNATKIACEQLIAHAKGPYHLPYDDTTVMIVRPPTSTNSSLSTS